MMLLANVLFVIENITMILLLFQSFSPYLVLSTSHDTQSNPDNSNLQGK